MTGTSDAEAIRHPRLITFATSQSAWQRTFDAALAELKANVRRVPDGDEPVLIEGGPYTGIWLESGPIDARAYAPIDPERYLAAHRIFFNQQRDDGQIPCFARRGGLGWSQVQTVTSLAVTALDCALHYGDDAFLEQAYRCCSRWDDWLIRYRDRRGLGLCEAFCEYDTGHDKSPRWQGLPKVCQGKDARYCPPNPRLPYLAPDLSASLYGGRVALAKMARRLGRATEAQQWEAKAAQTREAIMAHLFDEATLCFYDRDDEGRFVNIVGDVLLRVLAEGVVEPALFEQIFQRWVGNPEAFWTACPLPSIAICDPHFDWQMPDNSWGGPCQSLTALRAPLFMERYGKFAAMTEVMIRWARCIAAADGFRHQVHPLTGVFQGPEGYTPTMCVMLDYMLRLQGISVYQHNCLSWGCWYEDEQHERTCAFSCEQGGAKLVGRGAVSELYWRGQRLAEVHGRARVITDGHGVIRQLIGIRDAVETVTVTLASGGRYQMALEPDAVASFPGDAVRLQAEQVSP
ncbi:trehalase family glycosidase [Phycisphaerales bacterium AB-hyl4]|uniref:Trehalase family glycosidase n=1 Tax=Natronomicrosphaera hydrolytica TaxID=3242702 RepID=A0ABV4U2V0_9BACT